MKQQAILNWMGLPIPNMDIAATASSYIQSIKALQKLHRAVENDNSERLKEAMDEAAKLVKGAGFSL